MATDFRYAGISDLTKYFNKAMDYNNVRQLFSFTEVEVGQALANSVDTYMVESGNADILYRDGQDLSEKKQSVNTLPSTAVNYGAGYSALATSIVVDSGSALTDETYIKIGDEVLYITAISTNTLTVLRSRLGTTSSAIYDDDNIYEHFAPSADGQWLYDSNNDFIIMAVTGGSSPNDNLMEAGSEITDFINQTLTDASLELHNYIDARYSTPFQKTKQIDINTTPTLVLAEYDPIIIKSTCYIAAANLIRAREGSSEEADYYYSLVTNAERNGIIDKLNDGTYKLSFEVDAHDKKGKIINRAVAGTMDLVELQGEYSGHHYDQIKVDIDTSGVYGTATFTVSSLGLDRLQGQTSSPEIITGGLQHLHNGIYGRFQGLSAGLTDYWYVEVYDSQRKQTNKSNATIEMVR